MIPSPPSRTALLLAGLALLVPLAGCERAGGEVELAPLMGQLQHHAAKLGYAVAAHNQPLAGFYLEEVREVLERVEGVEQAEGVPIGATARTIMSEPVQRLAAALAPGAAPLDWSQAAASYLALVEGCNRCHAATGHEFLRILPAAGAPPFNQDFQAH